MTSYPQTLRALIHRNLLFVHGKGGVGKTTVSRAIAQALAEPTAADSLEPQKNLSRKTLWMTLEDPLYPIGEVRQLSPFLWHLNCDFTQAFEEYAALKIGMAPLTRIFLQNKLIRYLAKAAPGIHELVLLGKIWHERTQYAHVVVDLPSTGYGLAMFQSTENFVRLFHGGPLNKDANEMLGTFNDPDATGHLIVSLPEEMPLRESLELQTFLARMFPKNSAAFLVNRLFPKLPLENPPYEEIPTSWPSPLASSAKEYAMKRILLERYNLRLWREAGLSYGELDFVPPQNSSKQSLVDQIVQQLQNKAYT